jgi:two-component system sensor histidine kinase HydH
MSDNHDDAILIEAGRMASRLIHDFKNQLGGMKLYAAYLKKRFADNPEGVEIAEKIIQGLNEMADQAALIGRLMRPIELRREKNDPAQLLAMAVSGARARAESKQVRIAIDAAVDLPAVSFDLQQMQAAIASILARAIEASPEDGEVAVSLRLVDASLRIEVADWGETPEEQRLRMFFDPLTNERISQASLGLALARRVVELHGGEVVARAGSPTGTVVEVKLKI